MSTRLFSEFTSERGNDWRVEITDVDFSGTATEFNCEAPGFLLEYHGGENLFSPLMPSTLSVRMLVQSATDAAFIADLASFTEGRYYVKLYEDPDGSNTLHWFGLLTPESIRIPDQARPYGIELRAICGLATLSRKEYDSAFSVLTDNSAKDRVLAALAHIPQQRVQVPVLTNYLRVAHDVNPVTADATDTFIEDVYFGVEVYDPGLGARKLESCEQLLAQVALMMNARLLMYRGTWMLLPMGRFCTVSGVLGAVAQYDKNGTSLGTTTIYPNNQIDQINRHRLGGDFYYLPAVSKITRNVNYFGNSPFAGSRQLYPNPMRIVGHTTTSDPTSYTVSGSAGTTIAADKTLKVRGYAFITVPWTYTTVPDYDPQSRVHRCRVELKVKCGTLYLRRNIAHAYNSTEIDAADLHDPSGQINATIFNLQEPEPYTWTTNEASRVHFWTDILINGHSTYEGDPVTDQIDFEFLTPTLGSAENADVEITLQVRGYNGEASPSNPDAYGAAPNFYNAGSSKVFADVACYIGDGTDNGDILTFGAELDNGASEQMQITTGFYAEGPSSDVLNFNGAALVDASGANHTSFKSVNLSTGAALNTLLCIDQLEHFGRQQECYHGDFQSSDIITPASHLLFDSKKWAVLAMRHEGSSDLYDIELTAIQALGTLDPDSVDEVRRTIEIIHTPAGSIGSVQEAVERGRKDLMSITADIETDVAAALRTSDASGGSSSILLEYLGDVKISSPAEGQILEYNTAAQRWANTTPAAQGLGAENQTIAEGVTRDIVIDGDVSNNSYFRIVDSGGNIIFSIQNYGTVLNIVQYFGLIAYRSTATVQGAIALYEAAASGTNFIQIKAPNSLSSDQLITLPDSYGSSGQVLSTNGAGTLSWITPSSGGSGPAEIPLFVLAGRTQWTTTNAGRRMQCGNIAYGYNFYIWSQVVNGTAQTYSASDAVDTTTKTMANYWIYNMSQSWVSDSKKVRVKWSSRFQNLSGSTLGVSIWHIASMTVGSYQNADTIRLIAKSPDITPGSDSLVVYGGEFTGSTAYSGGRIMALLEHRSGTLSTTAYAYINLSLFAVD